MAIVIWRGDAQPIPQVTDVTFSNVEDGDSFTLTINRKDITVTVDDDTTTDQETLIADLIALFVIAIGQGNNDIAEWAEVSAAGIDADEDGVNDTLRLTGPADGKPFTVTSSTSSGGTESVSVSTVQAGRAALNEIQVIELQGSPTGGTFTLTYKDQTTAGVAYNASAATVETALNGLSSIGASGVSVTGDAGGPWTVEWDGTSFAGTNVDLLRADGGSLTGGTNVVVSEVTPGAETNDIWRLRLPLSPWGGNLGLMEVYYDIARDDGTLSTQDWTGLMSVSTLFQQNQGPALLQSNLPAGTLVRWVDPERTAAGAVSAALLDIEFGGDYAGDLDDDGELNGGIFNQVNFYHAGGGAINNPEDLWSLTQQQDGGSTVDEVQRVSLPNFSGSGTFTLTFEGQTTSGIAYDAAASAVETALEALSTIDGVSVTGDAGGPWLVTFDGDLVTGRDVELLTADGSSLTGGRARVYLSQESEDGVNERQIVTLLGNITGGTFTLTWDPGGGDETTGNIAYNASAATVQTALEGLTTPTTGDFSVTGADGGPWIVVFTGTYAETDVNSLSGDGTNLTGASSESVNISTSTSPSGPNWWSAADNWQTVGSSTPTAPAAGDVVVFEDNSVDCLYGLDDISGTLLELHLKSTYTGSLGLQVRNDDYYEYRTTELTIGATTVRVGEGGGNGSPRIRLNLGSAQTTVDVYQTGTSADTEQAVTLRGTHVSNVVRVQRGSVGIGTEEHEDAAAIATLSVGLIDSEQTDADVIVGSGVTQLTTVNHYAGSVEIQGDSSTTITTYLQLGGTSSIDLDSPVTTLSVFEGPCYYRSDGTVTNLNVGDGGEVYFTRDVRARTVTNCELQSGSTLSDPYATVTFTNGIVLDNCSLTEVTLDLGHDRTIDVS